VQEHSNDKPTTHQRDLTKLPRALAPLIERPQWAVWKWTPQSNGRWQKPPYQSLDPQRHASTKDSSTWSDYARRAEVQAEADGISYVRRQTIRRSDRSDHCRDRIRIRSCLGTEFSTCRHSSPSNAVRQGSDLGLTGLIPPVNRKFS
jgi:hypothetical protein